MKLTATGMMIPMKENHVTFLENDNISINKLIVLQEIVEVINEMKIRIVMCFYSDNTA